MITLYQFGNSVCCQKVRMVLAEKRLPWTGIEINLFTNEQYSPAYLKLNPKAVVPTILHEDRCITESTIICEYLDDVFPARPLVPSDPLQRAQMRGWSKLVDEGLHEGVSEISFSAMFRERMKASTPAQRETRFRNIGDPRRRDRFMSSYEHGVHSPYVRHAIAAYAKAFQLMAKTLADGRPWLVGATPTLADVALMPYVARLDYLGLLDIWIGDAPAVQHWWTRAQVWPSFVAGLAEPLSQAERDEMARHGPTIREGVREVLAEVLAAQREAALALGIPAFS